MKILIIMWRSPECRLPAKAEWLEKRFNRPITEIGYILAEFCKCDGNFYTQKRLMQEFISVRKFSKQQTVRAKSREYNKKTSTQSHAGPHQSGDASSPSPSPSPKEDKKELLLTGSVVSETAWQKIWNHGTTLIPYLSSRSNGEIKKWLDAGADVEGDIIPEITRLAATASNGRIKSWSYFSGAIMDSFSNRLKPLPKGNENGLSVQQPRNVPRNQTGNKSDRALASARSAIEE